LAWKIGAISFVNVRFFLEAVAEPVVAANDGIPISRTDPRAIPANLMSLEA
jgi:hypothetical protein